MTSRERVRRALRFERPDRVARDLWVLDGAMVHHKAAVEALRERFPGDIAHPPIHQPRLAHQVGHPTEVGTYVDEWGCRFENIQRGVVGEVKEPLVGEWSELGKVKAPMELVGVGLEEVDGFCESTETFVLAGWGTPFERMQYIRGSENLYMDIADPPAEFFELRRMVHEFNLAGQEALCRTKIDGIIFADDWGSQKALLISPARWRELYKPLYRDYAAMAKAAGKFVFMHSDGYIMDIYEDLIEIGVDAINSQLFCMPIEEIGKRFAGRITFWGEIDRQNLMPRGTVGQVREGVRRVWRNLACEGGGVIAQFEYGIDTRPENAVAAFEEWEQAGCGAG